MSIRIRNWPIVGIFAMVVFCLLPILSKAVTVEMEDDDEGLSASPTVAPVNKNSKIEPIKTPSSSPASLTESIKARVRIGDKIGFYYFVQSGFVTRNMSRVHSLGRVAGAFNK